METMEIMEYISQLVIAATIIYAIFYIRKLKKQISNVEKAFKELSMLYYEIKNNKENEQN